jgi:hypothetical protein
MSHEEPSATPTTTNASASLSPVPAEPSSPAPAGLRRAVPLGGRLLGAWQLIASVALAAGVLGWLLFGSGIHSTGPGNHEQNKNGNSANHQVEIAGLNRLRLKSESTLAHKIKKVPVTKVKISTPILSVTGTVVASLRQGNGKSDYWQFHTPEILTAFTDWQKAVDDIKFQENLLTKIEKLESERQKAQAKIVEKLVETVNAGAAAGKELDEARLKLYEQEIQKDRAIHEQQKLIKDARRTEAALTRQLQLAGLDPELLQGLKNDTDIVMAEVPESKVSLVEDPKKAKLEKKQACTARFFGVPNQVFSGYVISVAPVLSKEKRTLRVLFQIHDPKDQVYAGMFGDIGVGTNARDTILIPADAVLHLGQFDYVLKASDKADEWLVTIVDIGESHGQNLEVLRGLAEGDEILGKGVILLKPYIQQATPSAVDRPAQLQEKNPS